MRSAKSNVHKDWYIHRQIMWKLIAVGWAHFFGMLFTAFGIEKFFPRISNFPILFVLLYASPWALMLVVYGVKIGQFGCPNCGKDFFGKRIYNLNFYRCWFCKTYNPLTLSFLERLAIVQALSWPLFYMVLFGYVNSLGGLTGHLLFDILIGLFIGALTGLLLFLVRKWPVVIFLLSWISIIFYLSIWFIL